MSVVSPFYAAGLTHFDVLAPTTPPSTKRGGKKEKESTGQTAKSQLQTLSESSYSALVGAASLRWHALTVELQRRVDLLAEADPRPKTKLPGIDVLPTTTTTTPSSKPTATETIQQQAATRMCQHSNIAIINVCVGFERSSDIIDTFLPSPSTSSSTLRTFLRTLLLLLLWPLIWLLSKSPATAADSVVWATTRHLEPLSARFDRVLTALTTTTTTTREGKGGEVRRWQDPLIPGELYREGRIVRPRLPSRFGEEGAAWSELWRQTEHDVEVKVRQRGGEIKRPKV